MRQAYVHVATFLIVFGSVATASAQLPDLQTLEVESASVDRTMRFNIVLPPGYDTSGRDYPVLYLLHGGGGNYTDWGRLGAQVYARLYNDLIIVMPDGGNSRYVNWAESEDGQTNNWEDWIIKDLIPHIDANFRTIDRREGRAINGLSMGGFGAITLGLRHPDMFIAIGSTSGSLENSRRETARLREGRARETRELPPREQAELDMFRRRPDSNIGVEDFDSQVERTPRGTIFATPEDAEAYDPFELVLQVPPAQLPHIYLDCGLDDRLMEGSIRFARLLMDQQIPFEFMQLSGGHDSDYWVQSFGHIVASQYEVMQRALGDRPEM